MVNDFSLRKLMQRVAAHATPNVTDRNVQVNFSGKETTPDAGAILLNRADKEITLLFLEFFVFVIPDIRSVGFRQESEISSACGGCLHQSVGIVADSLVPLPGLDCT
jgi:hypothetical protein